MFPDRLSGRALHPGDWATFFDLNANGEIVAVNVKGDVHILRMQIWTG